MFDTNFSFYSLFLVLALISNIIVVYFFSRKNNIENREIVCLLLYENIGIIGGAKVLTYLLNYEALNGEFDLLTLGFTSYGAVIGAILFLLLFSVQFKKSFSDLISIFLPSIPLMYALGKIGCFLTGCCHGITYDGPFKVAYQYADASLQGKYFFPVQLCEAIAFLAIFIYLVVAFKKNKYNLKTLGIAVIFSAIAKFSLDYLRFSHSNILISTNQIISLIFILLGLILIKYKCQTTK